MNGNFDEASRSLGRLMEVAGGSASAYDDVPAPKPIPSAKPGWDEVVTSLSRQLQSPLENSPQPGEETLGASDEPSPEEMRTFWKEFHTYPKDTEAPISAEDSLRESEKREMEACGTFMEPPAEDVPNPQLALSRIPRPVSPEYRYVGPVENAGELFGLYNSFRDVLSGRPSLPVQLDSGEFELFALGEEFILEDKVKGFRYQSDRSKAVAPVIGDVFIWVFQINGNFFDKIGYISNESVF